ncbi:hypothetical protein ACU42Y_20950 [Proteus mirabilis]
MECLLAGREERLKKYENARLGIQLDEVIAAVAQVSKLCEKGGTMSDGRSNRKAKVVPFLDRLERDRNENLKSLIDKAKLMKLEGFESVVWEDSEWQVNAGRLVKLTGKNTKSASLVFRCH